MKIAVLSGSPNKKGTTDLLITEFIRGAEENGHEVTRYDLAFRNIHPCNGNSCNHCYEEGSLGVCLFDDDATEIIDELLEMDALVFATPIYFYGWNTYLKVLVERFYQKYESFGNKCYKCVLLTAYSDPINPITPSGAIGTFKGLLNYYSWEDCGMVIAEHCIDRETVEKTDFPHQAYLLGKGLM